MNARAQSESDILFLNHGATISDLAIAFRLAPKTVKERLTGKISPVKQVGNTLRYAIADAAPHLCTPKVDFARVLKEMSPSKLPPMLQDAFWKAQRNRVAFEEDQGDLWRTEKVIKVFSEVAKNVRTTLLMAKDMVESETAITAEQKQVIVDMMDGLLSQIHVKLVQQFENYEPDHNEHGRPIEDIAEEAYEAEQTEDAQDEEEFDDGFDD
jgi:hypothetical protein